MKIAKAYAIVMVIVITTYITIMHDLTRLDYKENKIPKWAIIPIGILIGLFWPFVLIYILIDKYRK